MSDEIINDDEILEDDEVIEEEETPVEEEIIEETTEEIVEEPTIPTLTEEEKEAARLEEERLVILAEENRQKDLKERYYSNLHDRMCACAQLGIPNGDAYFEQQILALKDHNLAEQRLQEIENKDIELYQLLLADEWRLNRENEFKQIDKLLLEALAEKEAGRSEKMQEYLTRRQAIITKYPKP